MLRKNLVFSNWVSFHKNTEFKARAAIYHFERLLQAYNQYIETQPFPEAQTILNVDHPLKEAVFFEFLATVTNLVSCFDSVLQEINCAYRLNLSPTFQRGQRYVKLSNIIKALEKKFTNHDLLNELNKLRQTGTDENDWFSFLRRIRNTGIHADIYSNSYETRDLTETFKRLQDVSQDASKKISLDDIKSAIKRDIVIRVDNKDYFMFRLVEFLKERMLSFIGNLHGIMIIAQNIG